MSSYYESLDEESQLYYDRKLTTADGKKLLDPMSLKDWKNNVASLPDVNWPDIYNFLVNTPSVYTHESMKVYKLLKAYEFFVCGHVYDVFYHQIDKSNHFCLVKPFTKVVSHAIFIGCT